MLDGHRPGFEGPERAVGELLDLAAGPQVDHGPEAQHLGHVTDVLVTHVRQRVAAIHPAGPHDLALIGLVAAEVPEVRGTVERDESIHHRQRSSPSMRIALPRQILSTTSCGRSAIICPASSLVCGHVESVWG